jgi:hypothetical protein
MKKFTVEIREYEPGGEKEIDTADIEEAIQDFLDRDVSYEIVVVEEIR